MHDPVHLEWTPERIERFWDYTARFPQQYFAHQFGAVIVRRLHTFLRRRSEVLDYGCGTGALIRHLLGLPLHVTATDVSPRAIEQAAVTHGAHPRFRGAFPVDVLLTRGDRYDALLAIELLEHLEEPGLVKVLSHLRALAAANAVVIFTTPNAECLERAEVFCPSCCHVFHRWQHVRSWTAENLTTRLRAAGFTPVSMFTTDFSISFRADWPRALRSWARRRLRRAVEQPTLVAVCRVT